MADFKENCLHLTPVSPELANFWQFCLDLIYRSLDLGNFWQFRPYLTSRSLYPTDYMQIRLDHSISIHVLNSSGQNWHYMSKSGLVHVKIRLGTS